MATLQVIEAYTYRNVATGQQISRFSVFPYGKREDWQRYARGYTWGFTDNRGNYTEGLGRKPVKTHAEAVEVAERFCEATGTTLIDA